MEEKKLEYDVQLEDKDNKTDVRRQPFCMLYAGCFAALSGHAAQNFNELYQSIWPDTGTKSKVWQLHCGSSDQASQNSCTGAHRRGR